MSFKIHSHAAAACPTLGLQERQAHDQRHHKESSKAVPPRALTDESQMDWSGLAKSSLAIRRAQDCQAVLGDALGFLQTQDEALARLQSAIAQPDSDFSRDLLESLTGEHFNGLVLFSRTEANDPIWIENLDTPDAVEISRPPIRPHLRLSSPHRPELLAEAREKNHRAQIHLESLLENLRRDLLDHELAPHQLHTREEALPCAEAARNALLKNTRDALAIQANSCHESILRLFE
jgi:hypothetical protein